ncbi:hypothetical protein J2X66_005866 [Pseudomonas sp. 3296]|uniref:hypothetical protein n=1 Tax=Pseudomonas sp. 3296 TaxID=2817753 RepID=UPI00285D87AD|nr:hypothetical protein [Pseudomonas sp. 3296]MDR6918961.1 hypothetical protein [Pseudomonas sp. 3296]
MSRHSCGKVAVVCKNAGTLLRYAAALNDLGYFTLGLCGSASELIGLFKMGKQFEYVIFDGFDLGIDAQKIKQIVGCATTTSIITVSDVNSIERRGIFLWAKQNKIPLLGVLQAPFRLSELQSLMGREMLFAM